MAMASMAAYEAYTAQVPLMTSMQIDGGQPGLMNNLEGLVHDLASKGQLQGLLAQAANQSEDSTASFDLSHMLASLSSEGPPAGEDEGIVNTMTKMKTERNGKHDREGQIITDGKFMTVEPRTEKTYQTQIKATERAEQNKKRKEA